MNSLLTNRELDILNRFLLDRLGCELRTEEEVGDEGILDISELDGFFTAVISGPRTILPAEWLPTVWGDYEPEWESSEEHQDIMSLLMRHMNGIGQQMAEQPQTYEPLFMSMHDESELHVTVDEWCCGYMKGVALAFEEWDVGGDEVADRLMPIILFASPSGWEALERMDEEIVNEAKLDIPPAVRALHAFWLGRRTLHEPQPLAIDSGRQIGRDDPCPCGSGRPFRKCCLH